MSGGHWDYKQDAMLDIIDDLSNIIINNESNQKDDYGDPIGKQHSPETIDKFKKAVRSLRIAYIYAKRIDWMLSGDDSIESFNKRLYEELAELFTPTNTTIKKQYTKKPRE